MSQSLRKVPCILGVLYCSRFLFLHLGVYTGSLDCSFVFPVGENHSVAVSQEGTVYTWGSGRWGQQGNGTLRNQRLPKAVPSLQGVWICTVACGCYHNVALSAQGEVFTWGAGARC